LFKISRLYFKLYLYFVAFILILGIVLPLILFSSRKPPHFMMFEVNDLILDSVKKSLSHKSDLKKNLENLGKEFKCDITLYNKEGKAIIWTGNYNEELNKEIITQVHNNYLYMKPEGPPGKDRFILLLNKEDENFTYISICHKQFDFFTPGKTLERLLVPAILLLIIIYPVSLYITKPLEKITKKAMKFAGGDFSDLDKKIDIKGNDEIAQLNQAFSHMANELVAMIEGKKELISDISHELGSPLSRMQVAVDIIEGKIEKGEMPPLKTVKKLSRNINEMSKLIRELLELSRMNKAYILNIEIADLGEILDDVIQKFQIIMEKNNISVKVHKEGDIKKVFVDKVKIARVIENLISNSLDYSPPGSEIEIRVKGEEGHFSVTIKDEGPGISKENKEKVFEPFFREDPSRTRKTGGTGLGLAIVEKIINLHGGTVEIENAGEKGAVITFKI